MNNRRLNLDEFNTFKNRLKEVLKKAEEVYEQPKNNPDFDEEAIEKKLIEDYLFIQNELLSYDLSDIPSSEWSGMLIYGSDDYVPDFSKTHANLDLDLFDYPNLANYRNCNVTGIKPSMNPSMFDDKTISENSSVFLSNNFSSDFQSKFYSVSLDMDDLVNLTNEQLKEFLIKSGLRQLKYERINSLLIETLGLERTLELYKKSREEYDLVSELLSYDNFNPMLHGDVLDGYPMSRFIEEIKNASISDIKKICFSYISRNMLTSRHSNIEINELPPIFVRENGKLLLMDESISPELREKYYRKELTLDEVINNIDLFDDIPIEYIISDNSVRNIGRKLGFGNLQILIKQHSDFFRHLVEIDGIYSLEKSINENDPIESRLLNAVKVLLRKNYNNDISIDSNQDGTISYNLPAWMSSFDLKVIPRLQSFNELINCDEKSYIMDSTQQQAVEILGIQNIKRIQEEYGFFSHGFNEHSRELDTFNALASFLKNNHSSLSTKKIDFKSGTLIYSEFLNQIANFLDAMRKSNAFNNSFNYDWIQGSFRDDHSDIFIDLDSPEELKDAFYRNKITPDFLYRNRQCIPYLINRNLSKTLVANIKLSVPAMTDNHGNIFPQFLNFINEYTSRHGNEKLLKLLSKYGGILSDINITSFNGEIENEEELEKSLRKSIYNKIIKGNMDYSYLSNIPEFISEYPDIFVNFDDFVNIPLSERKRLRQTFYNRTFNFDDLKKYPELAETLKEKNLQIPFGYGQTRLKLLEVLGNEQFLKLCVKYGRYMQGITQYLSNSITIKNGEYFISNKNDFSFESISRIIEESIAKECLLGNYGYTFEDAPDFLKKRHPELFLDVDAPDELKNYFYHSSGNYYMTFEILQMHKEWLPYLKNKSILTSLLKRDYLREDITDLFQLFGDDKAIELGMNKTETVNEMMKSHQIDLMKQWFDKTGGRFIPDFVVMQNFNINDADKFLISGSNWSKLMRIKNFAQTAESRDAMLKLAYSFGVFDQDQRGFKKLLDLLTGLPKKIDAENEYIIDGTDKRIEAFTKKNSIFSINKDYKKFLENMKQSMVGNPLLDSDILIVNLLESLEIEKVDIDYSKGIFSQLYQKNENGSYSLSFNQQRYPRTSQAVRNILEGYRQLPILTPNRAHQLFGGFELKYDVDFREFLLANMEKILNNSENASLVSSIQRQFSNIKAINSNRTLTWELAVDYGRSNKYYSVNVGNERASEISAIAGYSQSDFDILQQIYNYGKQRTFSSIPRIEHSVEKNSGKYFYEILKLDDPLAMAIGTLTDCCQELNNCAEVCMEHSMLDKNGRVFVIKDEHGNIVAQSWVWRNRDVLCFDNIEIPDKAFSRATKDNPNSSRKEFTDEIYEIYKQAAHDLIEADERVYRSLLESGKITKEQYDGLRLGKITVGLGNNDIAESLKRKSVIDRGIVSRPLLFVEPVKLSKSLYTDDSTTQYILEEREDRKGYNGETLPIHNDTYTIYDDTNFNEKFLLFLEKLEIVTKGDSQNLEIPIHGSEHLVTEIAQNYGLNPKTTRIIMNPNFAIIYDFSGEKIRIGELLYNTKIDNNQQQMDIEQKVIIQLRLAFDQISEGKEIDISSLDEKQKEMYNRVIGMTNEIDIERGIDHAR